MNEFERRVGDTPGNGLHAADIRIIQLNLGLRCNQQCTHCHVEASPHRSEAMDWSIMEQIVQIAGRVRPELVDLTGGSPELNPNFKRFVGALCDDGHKVQDRTNLTVLVEPGLEDLPGFMRDRKVQLVGSMPCYLEENVCTQRGVGTYTKSIEAIKRLNTLGYGIEADLPLNLVYNPLGPYLPPSQADLEADYRRQLGERFGIKFTGLLTITNMPIGRFGQTLTSQGEIEEYMKLLKHSFNPNTVEGLMCRHQLSIGWDGALYDCDFNLALGLSVDHGAPEHIRCFDLARLLSRRIVTDEHCFGCTAGGGSSCRGALVTDEGVNSEVGPDNAQE
jgi:radical SAM/Cys-rich protein